MSMRVGTPVNQKRLTNVSVVKLMKTGKRFEIACYCNKVESYRKGIETDITEVLQSEFVFTNVSKGNFASSKELKKAFGTEDIMSVCKVILADGELQLTAKERQAHTESTFRDIATIISEKCVNPSNSRPYTVSTILSALRDDLKYGLVPGRSAKQQALDLIKRLQAVIPIARAKMHVRIHDTEVNEELRSAFEALEVQKEKGGLGMDYFIEPDVFKDFSSNVAKFNGRVEVVQLSAVTETAVAEKSEPINDLAEVRIQNTEKQIVVDDEEEVNVKTNEGSERSGKKSKATKRREKEEAAQKLKAKREAKQRQEDKKSAAAASEDTPALSSSQSDVIDAKSCTTCGGCFKSAAEHRAHFKTNWHRFNLKLKMANQPVVSEAEFLAVDAEDFF